MSYLTLEVKIDHGQVIANEPGRLPEKGSGLLTILHSSDDDRTHLTPLQALSALQKHLDLDSAQAAKWMDGVREARR